ncbi:MAG: dihydroneopterin aldolase [Alloprevotella sp.]|nr:dihydroneopterin aldolase [Alloprevotella sp.]
MTNEAQSPRLTVRLRNIRLRAFHGCLPQERTVGNDYEVSATLDVTGAEAAVERDELCGTVDYAAVYALIREEMGVPSQLLEHVCGRIVRRLLEAFPQVERATVTVTKLRPPIPGADCDGAGVTLTDRRGA